MGKSIKLKDNNYLDSSSVVYQHTSADEILKRGMWYKTPNTSGVQWYKLGTVKILNQLDVCYIKCFTGEGQNGESRQNCIIDIMIKKGWQSEPSTTKYVGCTYTIYNMANENINSGARVKIMCTEVGYIDVWVKYPANYSGASFNVDGNYESFTVSDEFQADEPTKGTEQDCIGGVIKWDITITE